MPDEVWQPVSAALDRVAARGRTIEVWLRDDDAVAPTAALDRLVRLCEARRMPVLLAVIPAMAETALAAWLTGHPSVTPTQHGFRHANHAHPGERARELGGMRPVPDVLDDLHLGRDRLVDLFGADVAHILVPPWNRIDDDVAALLPTLGFTALSTFGPPGVCVPGLKYLNTDLDIIDWRNGRVGRAHGKLAGKLADLIESRIVAPRPIGILTHHLVHDDTAWTFLEQCLDLLQVHPAVRFSAATVLATAQ